MGSLGFIYILQLIRDDSNRKIVYGPRLIGWTTRGSGWAVEPCFFGQPVLDQYGAFAIVTHHCGTRQSPLNFTQSSQTPYVRRSKLNSCGEDMASLHKAPYRYTQSQHLFHQLGRIAAGRGGSRWGIGFLFPLRWYLQGNSNFYVITKADVDSFS